MKKKRVETFRNIRYPVGRTICIIGASVSEPPPGGVNALYIYITSAMLSIVGERERNQLGVYAHARFLSGCSGMECLASYYCVSLVPRPIERVESIVVIISVTLKSSRSLVCRL